MPQRMVMNAVALVSLSIVASSRQCSNLQFLHAQALSGFQFSKFNKLCQRGVWFLACKAMCKNSLGLPSCSKTFQTITLRRCSSTCWMRKASRASTTSCTCRWISDLDLPLDMHLSILSRQKTLSSSNATSKASAAGHSQAAKLLKSLGAAQCKVSQQPLIVTATAPSCTRTSPSVTSHASSKMACGFAFHRQQNLSVCPKRWLGHAGVLRQVCARLTLLATLGAPSPTQRMSKPRSAPR